jgi:hypothetical protein
MYDTFVPALISELLSAIVWLVAFLYHIFKGQSWPEEESVLQGTSDDQTLQDCTGM